MIARLLVFVCLPGFVFFCLFVVLVCCFLLFSVGLLVVVCVFSCLFASALALADRFIVSVTG